MNIYLIIFIIILTIVIILINNNCNNNQILENFTMPPSNTSTINLNSTLGLSASDINVNQGNVNILSTTTTSFNKKNTILSREFSTNLNDQPDTGNLTVSGNLILSKNSKIQIGDIVISTGTYTGYNTYSGNGDQSNAWIDHYSGASFLRFTHLTNYNNPSLDRKSDIPGPGQVDIILNPNSEKSGLSALLVRGDYLFSNPLNDGCNKNKANTKNSTNIPDTTKYKDVRKLDNVINENYLNSFGIS